MRHVRYVRDVRFFVRHLRLQHLRVVLRDLRQLRLFVRHLRFEHLRLRVVLCAEKF